MSTLTSTFNIEDNIWVVDQSVPVLYHGKIIEVILSTYNNNGSVIDAVTYNVLLDNDFGTLKSTDTYMRILQADAMILLATLIDGNVC